MREWIAEFDCGEAWLIQSETRPLPEDVTDDLGCAAIAIYGPEDGVEIEDMWTKNGYMRVKFRKVNNEQSGRSIGVGSGVPAMQSESEGAL